MKKNNLQPILGRFAPDGFGFDAELKSRSDLRRREHRRSKKQIPFGDDNKKGKTTTRCCDWLSACHPTHRKGRAMDGAPGDGSRWGRTGPVGVLHVNGLRS